MKRVVFVVLGCVCSVLAHGQCFSGELASELHWNMKKKVNWTNQLRLNLSIPLWNGAGSIEASTLHMLRTNETIIDDWQGFSNIEEENTAAAIAVLGYMHQWERAHLFFGVRNVNEDFFTSDVTSLFFNGSCGIFPTIAASYPIANYPLSGLTMYFDVSKGGFTFRNSLYNGVGYNGWSKHDNPFLVRPKKDGIFNMSQLEFSYSGGNYFAGAAVHTRHYGVDPDGNQCEPDQSTKRRVAPGGCMASRRCGKPPTRKSPAWRSIPRIPIATTAATAMPSWGWLTPTVATSADCRGSMPDSIRVRNIRSNSHGDAVLKSGSACNRRCSTSTTEMAILWCFAPG